MAFLDILPWIISGSLSAIIIATYRFMIRRQILKTFQRDPSIKRVRMGMYHYLERENSEPNPKKSNPSLDLKKI